MTIAFTKVALPFGWLGNMSPYPVTHEGLEWRTTEHLFQALRFPEGSVREEIRASKSPMGAKMVAKKHTTQMVVPPRSAEDLDLMRLVLRLKVEQHPALRLLLLNTGEHLIVEDVSSRPSQSGLFWGMRQQGDVWTGENHLGKLWMDLRSGLKP